MSQEKKEGKHKNKRYNLIKYAIFYYEKINIYKIETHTLNLYNFI